MKKVLFIGHDGSRTGAPIILLHLLRWLKENSDLSFEILLRRDGELKAEYEKLAPVWVLHEKMQAPGAVAARAARRMGLPLAESFLARQLARRQVDLIYSNTVENWGILRDLAFLECPIITHVHELNYWIEYKTGLENFRHIQDNTDFYVAASRAVKQNLVENHQITADKIEVVHEFIPTQTHSSEQRSQASQRIREKLNIPGDALIVGGAGTTDWRKGADLFVRLAATVRRQQPTRPIYFLWVGGQGEGGEEFGALWLDAVKLRVDPYIKFLGVQSNPLDYFSAFDVFALVSREDPYPLVMLECASLAKPILCFENSGGAPEFVDESCGFVVPYLDVDEMARRIFQLHDSVDLRSSLGENAAHKVRLNHDIGVSAPRILEIIEMVSTPSLGHVNAGR